MVHDIREALRSDSFHTHQVFQRRKGPKLQDLPRATFSYVLDLYQGFHRGRIDVYLTLAAPDFVTDLGSWRATPSLLEQ